MDFLKLLETLRFPAGDIFFQFCTFLGQDIPVLLVICLLFWCLNKRLAYQMALSFFASGLLLQGLKISFRIERPWVRDPGFHPVPSAISAATGYSFPSGHTQTATSLFTTLALFFKKWPQKLLCIFLFLLVGFSRLYLGVHTPADVLTAMLLALFISVCADLLMKRLKNNRKKDLLIGICLTAASLAVLTYAWYLMTCGTLPAEQAEDCCKAAGAGLGFSVGWYLERSFICFDETGSLQSRALRFVCGVLGLLLIKGIMKGFLGSSIPAEILQYFLLVLWITCIYPWFFSRSLQR